MPSKVATERSPVARPTSGRSAPSHGCVYDLVATLTAHRKQATVHYTARFRRASVAVGSAVPVKGCASVSTTADLVLAADAAIDLQMHTTFSDGVWAPDDLIDYLAH